MIIMSLNYYLGLVTALIAQSPEFQKISQNTCPTRWADDSICSPADDTMNKAFMEAEYLMELELI